jgi:hypothetical protein
MKFKFCICQNEAVENDQVPCVLCGAPLQRYRGRVLELYVLDVGVPLPQLYQVCDGCAQKENPLMLAALKGAENAIMGPPLTKACASGRGGGQ